MPGVISRWNAFNDRVAVSLTRAFGSMWAFYLFVIFPLVGFVVPAWSAAIMLISSCWIQLWALPAILVGTKVTSRETETVRCEDHTITLEAVRELGRLEGRIDEFGGRMDAAMRRLDERMEAGFALMDEGFKGIESALRTRAE